MTLYLPMGAPGAGKTTLVRKALIEGVIHPEEVVCPDDYRVILTGTKGDQSANGAVFEIVNKIVDQRIQRGLNVWLDATNLASGPREGLILLALRYEQPVVCIPLQVSTLELRRRNLIRTDPVPFDVLENMVGKFNDALAQVKATAHHMSHVTVSSPGDVVGEWTAHETMRDPDSVPHVP